MQATSHPQDDLLIVEALYRHGHAIEDDPERSSKAFELARDIAGEHGLDVSDALFQIERGNESEPTASLNLS